MKSTSAGGAVGGFRYLTRGKAKLPASNLRTAENRTTTDARARGSHAVHSWFVVPSVLGALILAAILVPKKTELVKRLMEDGQHERALEVATDHALPAPVVSQPAIAQEAAPPSATVPKPKSPLDLLKDALTADPSGLGGAPGTTAEAATMISQAPDLLACVEVVRALDPGLTAAQRETVYLAMGKSALAKGDPGLAAQLFEEAANHGIRTPELLLQTVQAWRWCGHPEKAQAALEKWQAAGPLPDSLVSTEISTLRELNRPGEALRILLDVLKAEKGASGLTQANVLLASEVAANAGQMDKALPFLADYLASLPAGKATVEELATGKVTTDDEWKKFTKLVAQHCEWGGQPDQAFDHYMKLAVTGDRFALDRILALDPGLSRDGDVMTVLRHVVPVEGKPELTRMLAKMLADAAEYSDAEHWYGQWLEKNPRDVSARRELAGLYEEQSQPDRALETYRKALEIDPGNLEMQKEIADIQISQRQFREAFAFYQQLPEKDHDNFTLENFALLAESLAEYRAFNRALVLRQHRLKNPTTQDFLELARSFEVIGDSQGVIDTYQDGLTRNPRSRIMKVELANTFRRAERYDEAIALLAVPELKSDMHAMQLFIEVCCLKEDYQFALAFLGRSFEKRFAFGPDTLLDLGHIYFNNGYLEDADALYSSIPEEPTMWPLLATARFKRGDFVGAERFQKKHLTALQVPDPQGWMFMGDIYKMLGQESDAAAAYAKSLSLMEQKLDSAAEPSGEHPATSPDRQSAANFRP